MTANNLVAFTHNRKNLATEHYSYPIGPGPGIPIRHKVAEEPDEYQTGAHPKPFPQAVRKIEIDALRQVADSHICRVLKLANILDSPLALDCTEEERKLATQDLRTTATLLEECFHALIKTAENSNQT